jgi:hypothetical protein
MSLEILSLFKKDIPTIYPFFVSAWEIIKIWWWLPIPFLLWKPFSFIWLWWRTDCFLKDKKFVLFEVKIPKEVLKPIRAMENVIDGLWQVLYDPPGFWWEKWIEGKVLLSYSFDIISVEGDIHFFIRTLEANRHSVEASIYSQYPEAEISIVSDYTKNVPADIPNKDWDLWGADYRLLRDNSYPIKTYKEFETEKEALEEKRIDPLAILFEASAKIEQGEQLWIQILAGPVADDDFPWITRAKKLRDELVRRKAPPAKKSMFMEGADILIGGKAPGQKGEEKEVIPPEMKLTPGERDIVAGLEQKIAKRGFKTSIRFIYLGKKDVFFKPKIRLPLAFFSAFATENFNMLVPYGQPLITKIPKSWFLPLNLFRDRRLYLRKRAIFRKYKIRVNPYFPREKAVGKGKKDVFILNTEELASIFHFPGKRVAPAPFIERIEAKKGEAPPGLPME